MLDIRIATLRKEKGLSQEELADILNTSRQAISKWERGEAYPDIDNLKDIATYFNVSIDYLLGYDLESLSLKDFIERLKKNEENWTFDISIDEIKMVVARNNNNFDLLTKAIDYLFNYWSVNHDDESIDLVGKYAEKAILAFQADNIEKITVTDLQHALLTSYAQKGEYQLAKDYVLKNHVQGAETLMADIEYELKNYDEAITIVSDSFLKSVVTIINSSGTQIRVLAKMNRYKEAYELADWCLSFIKSVAKKENMFAEVGFILNFLKAAYEHHNGLDWLATFNLLKDLQSKNQGGETANIKFYYNKNAHFITMIDDTKEYINKNIIDAAKDSELYEDFIFIRNKLFGKE